MPFIRPNTGGGSTLGVATIWSSPNQSPTTYLNWAALSSIVDPRQDDEALVIDIDGNGNVGFARYSTTLEAWGLWLGQFSTIGQMEDFPNPILPSANAIVNSRTFVYGEVTAPDASTPSFWIPQDVYDNLNTFAAFLNGDEADAAARLAHGFTDVIAGGTTITGDISSTGYTRIASPSGAGTNTGQLQTLASSITASTKVYMKFRMKVSASGSVGAGSVIGAFVADGTKISYPRQVGTSQSFAFQNTGSAIISPNALRSGGSVLPATDTWIEYFDDGRTVLASVYRDGVLYHSEKRDTNNSTSNVAGLIGAAVNAPTASFVDFKDVIVLTYT